MEPQLRQRLGSSRHSESDSGNYHASFKQDHQNIDLEGADTGTRLKWGQRSKLATSFTLSVIVVFVCASFLFVKYMDNRLPRPLTEKDAEFEPTIFIEERARKDLQKLTENGPRVTGSYITDVLTVGMLTDLLEEIKSNMSSVHDLAFEVQRPSGAFFMDDDEGHTSTYGRVFNFVAKLEPSNPADRTNNSFLFNCHFDSKPGSPGATDNMISCVAMIEIIRVLARQEIHLQNTLLFLFNGAEELGMQGAHGFVAGWENDPTQVGHPWAKTLRAAVNLEGAGAGGRPILFQTGPGNGWILRLYSSTVPRPFGTAMAEEAFQRGLIPSDTDFRMFRDYSNVPGLDMSIVKNGWVYHTKWDKVQEIPPGCIQHVGSNALALAERLGTMDYSEVKLTDGKMVFFDCFGLFMIVYSETVGIVVNVLVVLVTFGLILYFEVFRPKKFLLLLWFLGSTILAWGAGIAVAVTIGALMNAFGYYSPFHSYPSLLLIIFGLPAVLTQIVVYAFVLRGNEDHAWLAGKLTLAVLTFIGTFVTRAVFVMMIVLLFGAPAWFLTKRLFKARPKVRLLLYIVVGELIPFNLTIYVLNLLNDVFVPVMARSGPGANPNIFLGLITAAFTSILAFNGLASFFVGFKKRHLVTALGVSAIIVNSLVVFGFVGKVPYQEKTSMRLNLIEVERMWFTGKNNAVATRNESGILFWPMDPNTGAFMSTFAQTVPEVNSHKEVSMDIPSCPDLYCGVPQIWTASKSYEKVYWVPKENRLPESWKENIRMHVLEKTKINDTTWQLKLQFAGPTQISFVLSPGPRFRLSYWDITPELPPQGIGWKDRDTHFVFHERGVDTLPYEVTFHLEKNLASNSEDLDTLLDVHFSSFFLYEPKMMTSDLTEFANKFPSWVFPYAWTAIVQFYSIAAN